MTGHPCRWCGLPLTTCIVREATTTNRCCIDCKRTEPCAHAPTTLTPRNTP